MKIQTKQLKAFNSAAGNMRPNSILPILSYLKLENGKIIKSNMESFITMDIDFDGACLIDEKVLMGFVESVAADEINVEVKGTSVALSCGKEKIVSPTTDILNYPEISDAEGDGLFLSPEVLRAVKTAANFTMERDNLPFASCVFISSKLVAATSGFVAYAEKVEDELPNIILEPACVSALKRMEFASFQENETYLFFSHGNFVYGFVKKETPFVDMKRFSELPEGEVYPSDKSEILRFCDATNAICTGRAVVAKIKNNILSMADADYGINSEKQLTSAVPDFSFNPSMMSKLLRSLPDDQIKILKSTNKLFITGGGNYTSLIMELA